MRSRMSSETAGALVRSKDSVQPVHSWKCSQMTDGLTPAAAFSAQALDVHDGNPTALAASVQTFRKSRRLMPRAARSATEMPLPMPETPASKNAQKARENGEDQAPS